MGRAQSLMKPECFAFDLDGTLVDSNPGIASALRAAFASIGRAVPDRDIRSAIGPPIRILARRLDPQLTDDQCAAIEQAYRTLYDGEHWRQTLLFEGVDETLRHLHRTARRLFVVTNKPRIPTLKILQHFKLEPLFADIVTRDSTNPPFPNKAAMLRHLILHHQFNPAAATMVGDTAEDEEAAVANEIPFLFMTYGYGVAGPNSRRLERFADLLLNSPEEGVA
jgi:phosphoglycolate phosphatase